MRKIGLCADAVSCYLFRDDDDADAMLVCVCVCDLRACARARAIEQTIPAVLLKWKTINLSFVRMVMVGRRIGIGIATEMHVISMLSTYNRVISTNI